MVRAYADTIQCMPCRDSGIKATYESWFINIIYLNF